MKTKLIRLGDTPLIHKFWKLVDKNGPVARWRELLGNCWLWLGPVNDSGYPYFCINSTTYSATHISWELANPWKRFPESMDAAHLCNVPSCVRPEHILPMTHADNLLMETLERATLSPCDVTQIKTLADVKTIGELAAMFSVSDTTISRAIKGQTWAGVHE